MIMMMMKEEEEPDHEGRPPRGRSGGNASGRARHQCHPCCVLLCLLCVLWHVDAMDAANPSPFGDAPVGAGGGRSGASERGSQLGVSSRPSSVLGGAGWGGNPQPPGDHMVEGAVGLSGLSPSTGPPRQADYAVSPRESAAALGAVVPGAGGPSLDSQQVGTKQVRVRRCARRKAHRRAV